MKVIGKKLMLVFLAFLSAIMVLCGVTALTVSAEEQQPEEEQTTVVSADWYELEYSNNSVSFLLNTNFREYFGANRNDFKKLFSSLSSAAYDILIEGLLGNITLPEAAGGSGVAPIDLPSTIPPGFGEFGEYDNFDWTNSPELVQKFKELLVETLSEPENLEGYLNGDYDMVIEYAVGKYIESEGGSIDLEQQEKLAGAIEKVVTEATEQAAENFENQLVEQLKAEGKTEEEAKAQAQQAAEAWKADVHTKRQEKEEENSIFDIVEKVEANGGKVELSLSDVMKAVKEVVYDGDVLLYKGNIKFEGLKHLVTLLPKPGEIKDYTDEQMKHLIGTDITIRTTMGDITFDVNFGLYGNHLHEVRTACGYIAQYLDVSYQGGVLTVKAEMPEVFTKALLKLTETKHLSDEMKHKLFSLFGWTSGQIFDKATGFSFDELMGYLEKIDFQHWFSNFLNADFINTYFGTYYERVFNNKLTQETIDHIIDEFASRAANLASRLEDWSYETVLKFLRDNIPGFSKLENKIPAKVGEAVDKLFAILQKVDWAKYDAEYVHDILDNSTTFNDTVISYIEKYSDTVEHYYDLIVSYMKRLFDFVPEKIQNGTVLDLYRSNGYFSFEGGHTFDIEKYFNRAVQELEERGYNVPETLKNMIHGLDRTVYTVNLSLHLTTHNIHEITYMAGSEELGKGLLPDGADLVFFANKATLTDAEGSEYPIAYWYDEENDVKYGKEGYTALYGAGYETKAPAGDITVYAVTDFHLDQSIDEEPTHTIEAVYDAEKEYRLTVSVRGTAGSEYTFEWFDGEGNPIPAEKVTVAEDGKSSYITVSEVADSGNYTALVTDVHTGISHTVADGETTVTAAGETADLYDFIVDITKAQIGLTYTWTIDGEEKETLVFDMGPHTAAAEYTLTLNGEPIDEAAYEDFATLVYNGDTEQSLVGEYSATFTLTLVDDANYEIVYNEKECAELFTSEPFEWSITKLILNVTFNWKLNKDATEGYEATVTYDGTEQTLEADAAITDEDWAGAESSMLAVNGTLNGEPLSKMGTMIQDNQAKAGKYVYALTVGPSYDVITSGFEDCIEFVVDEDAAQFTLTIAKAQIGLTYGWKLDGAEKTELVFDNAEHTAAADYTLTLNGEALATDDYADYAKIAYDNVTGTHANTYQSTFTLTPVDEANYEIVYNEKAQEGAFTSDPFEWKITPLTIEFSEELSYTDFADNEDGFEWKKLQKDSKGEYHLTFVMMWEYEVKLEATNLPEGVTLDSILTFSGNKGANYQEGGYKLTAALLADVTDYALAKTELATWYIDKIVLDVTLTWQLNDETAPEEGKWTVTYNKEQQKVKGILVIDGDTTSMFTEYLAIKATLNGEPITGMGILQNSQTDAGTYTYVVTSIELDFSSVDLGGAEANFEINILQTSDPMTVTLTIAQAEVTANVTFGLKKGTDPVEGFTVPYVKGTTYTLGYEVAITAPAWATGLKDLIVATAGNSGFTGTNATDYTATVTLSIAADYQKNVKFAIAQKTEYTQEWSITKATVDLSGASWDATGDIVYDGQPHARALVLGSVTLPEGATFTYTYTKDGQNFDGVPTDVGAYVVTATLNVGDDSENYEITGVNPTNSFNITPAQATVAFEWTSDWYTASGVSLDFGSYTLTYTVKVVYGVSDTELAADLYTVTTQPATLTFNTEGSHTATVTVALNTANYALTGEGVTGGTFTATATFTIKAEEPSDEYWEQNKSWGSAEDGWYLQITGGNVSKDLTPSATPDSAFTLDDYLEGLKAKYGDREFTLGSATDLHFSDGSEETAVTGTFLVRLLIPENLRSYPESRLAVIHITGTSFETVQGAHRSTAAGYENFMEFQANGFSTYAVIGMSEEKEAATGGLAWWIWLLLAIIIVILLVALIVVIVLIKKKGQAQATAETETAAVETVETAETEETEEAETEETETAEEPAAEETAEEPAEEPAEEEPQTDFEQRMQEFKEEIGYTEEPAATEPAPEEVETVSDLDAIAPEAAGVITMYDRSFTARLSQAELNVKNAYNEIKNELLAYKNVKSHISWNYDSFNKGRVKLAKLVIKGKTLTLYLALDPAKLDEKYHVKDASDVAKYKDVPAKLKVRSTRAVKYAKELIAKLMEEHEIARREEYTAEDYRIDTQTLEELIEAGLVKVKISARPEFWGTPAAEEAEAAADPETNETGSSDENVAFEEDKEETEKAEETEETEETEKPEEPEEGTEE